MHAGLLNKRITIQTRTSTQDASGQPLETWTTFATVSANIKPLVGRDYLAAKEMVGEISHDLTIRYLSGVLPNMRVKYGDRYFQIVGPALNPEERNVWLYLKCREVVEG